MVGHPFLKPSLLATFISIISLFYLPSPVIAATWDLGLLAIRRESVRIPMEPGVELIGTIYQKRGARGGQPLVLLLNPWSIGSWVYGIQANALAERGFTVLSYNLRGWSGSSGEVDAGGAIDVSDVSRVIDWAAWTHGVDVSRVGIGGVSLGAGVALNAAAFEPRIRAVASMSTWTNLYTPIYGNSTKRVFWDSVLWLGSIAGTGSPEAARLQETYDAIESGDYETIRSYAYPRSPVNFLNRFAIHKPAILLSQNMSDILFPVSDVWRFFEALPSPKKMSLQPGIHATVEITGIVFPFKDQVWDDSIEWFERWLKPNHPSHEEESSEIQVSLRNGKSFVVTNTSDLDLARGRFYLTKFEGGNKFGTLKPDPSASGTHTIESGYSSGVVSGIPLLGALVRDKRLFQSTMKESAIRLDQAALYELPTSSSGFDLLGIPKIHLNLRVEGDHATFVSHLFRLDKKGIWHLISMTPYTLQSGDSGRLQTVEFDLYGAFDEFELGDRLVLAIDTYDPEFTLASGAYKISIENDGESWIDLPLSRDD